MIYYNFIQPVFKKHESQIDAALNRVLDPKSVIDAALKASSKTE